MKKLEGDYVKIPACRYFELLKKEDELNALKCSGVDNWGGYGQHYENMECEEDLLEYVYNAII